jgi:two-component system, NarL family, nitrate/nitrite response regulator NarL
MTARSKTRHRRIRVLIADPWPLFLEEVARVVKARPDFQLAGAVSDDEFLATLTASRPDVALLDPTNLSEEDREEVFSRIRAEGHRVVFISEALDHKVYEAISRGVLGYLSKDCKGSDICDAIAIAARGDDIPLAQANLEALVKEIRLRHRDERPHLTSRERQILTLLANGYSAPEIAKQIHLASSTIRTHLRNIYKKLSVGGQVEAVAVAFRVGLIT